MKPGLSPHSISATEINLNKRKSSRTMALKRAAIRIRELSVYFYTSRFHRLIYFYNKTLLQSRSLNFLFHFLKGYSSQQMPADGLNYLNWSTLNRGIIGLFMEKNTSQK